MLLKCKTSWNLKAYMHHIVAWKLRKVPCSIPTQRILKNRLGTDLVTLHAVTNGKHIEGFNTWRACAFVAKIPYPQDQNNNLYSTPHLPPISPFQTFLALQMPQALCSLLQLRCGWISQADLTAPLLRPSICHAIRNLLHSHNVFESLPLASQLAHQLHAKHAETACNVGFIVRRRCVELCQSSTVASGLGLFLGIPASTELTRFKQGTHQYKQVLIFSALGGFNIPFNVCLLSSWWCWLFTYVESVILCGIYIHWLHTAENSWVVVYHLSLFSLT